MLPVAVTVTLRGRTVPLENVKDPRIAKAFRAAGEDIGRKLSTVTCPEHAGTAQNVRLHFDVRGNADLKYDSCCEKLGAAIGDALS